MSLSNKLFPILCLVAVSLVGCGPAETNSSQSGAVGQSATQKTSSAASAGAVRKSPNFLVMIGDDMSTETVGCYKVGSDPAKTPTLDSLCNDGMRFDNFWAQPVCSPTRASILTGQFGFRNGVGAPAGSPSVEYPRPEKLASAPEENSGRTGRGNNAMGGNGAMAMGMAGPAAGGATAARPGLYPDAYGLPAALVADSAKQYQTAAVGKWHLADDNNGGLDHPQKVGFQHYSGNLNGGGVESFYSWSKVVDGEHTAGETKYATSVTVDDALNWLDNKRADDPWLLWVAFNAPHSPWGEPPKALLSAETVTEMAAEGSTLNHYQAMIEAMDTEVGRLLAGIDPAELENTYVIFLGDNGTPSQAVTPPIERGKAKGSLYQGGVNVPFMVAGPGVDGGTVSAALANSVDIYQTIIDLAGTATDSKLDAVNQDSVSLSSILKDPTAAVREYAYADVFGNVGGANKVQRTIRNTRYKLIRNLTESSEEFFDLRLDPYEKIDLMQANLSVEGQKNYDQLTAALEELVSDASRTNSN